MKLKNLFIFTLCAILAMGYGYNGLEASSQCNSNCAPKVKKLLKQDPYKHMYSLLSPQVDTFTQLVYNTIDQPSYQNLLAAAQTLASSVAGGRVIVCDPFGNVIVDTGGVNNTYANYLSNTVSSSNCHNFIRMLDTAIYPCGLGAETTFSIKTRKRSYHVAASLGKYLNTLGCVSLTSIP